MLGYWEGIHGNARPGGCRGIGEVRKAWKSVAMDAGGAAEARGTMSYVESQRNEGRCMEISRDEMVLFCRRTGGVAKNIKEKRKKGRRKEINSLFNQENHHHASIIKEKPPVLSTSPCSISCTGRRE